jgi:hypothetical protein
MKKNSILTFCMNKTNWILMVFIILLLTSSLTRLVADEIIGVIMFPPEQGVNVYPNIRYYLDTNQDLVVDCFMEINKGLDAEIVFNLLPKYLDKGWKVVFENKRLKARNFSSSSLIAIISPEGQYIELTQMFSPDVIKDRFPPLQEKLLREGRTK